MLVAATSATPAPCTRPSPTAAPTRSPHGRARRGRRVGRRLPSATIRQRRRHGRGIAAATRDARRPSPRLLVHRGRLRRPGRVPIEEDDRLGPTNPYGETKLPGERLLAAAAEAGGWSSSPCATSTPAAPTATRRGPRARRHTSCRSSCAPRRRPELRVFGDDYPTPDGTCVRDYVHVVDLADAHVAALEGLPGARGVFNLGTGSGDSVLTVLDAVEKVTGRPLRRVAAPRRPGDPPALVASNGAPRRRSAGARVAPAGRGARRLGVDAGAPGRLRGLRRRP